MIRMRWLTMLALFAASPTLAQAQQSTPEVAAREAKIGSAIAAIQAGKPADAIAIVDPLLIDYQKLYAGERRRMYCAGDPAEAALYRRWAAAEKQDAVTIEGGWCTALWARGFAMIDLEQLDAAVPFLERAVRLRLSGAEEVAAFLRYLCTRRRSGRQPAGRAAPEVAPPRLVRHGL